MMLKSLQVMLRTISPAPGNRILRENVSDCEAFSQLAFRTAAWPVLENVALLFDEKPELALIKIFLILWADFDLMERGLEYPRVLFLLQRNSIFLSLIVLVIDVFLN